MNDLEETESKEPNWHRLRLVRTYSSRIEEYEEDETDALPKKITINCLDFLAIVISIGSYLFDTITDMLVAYFHHRDGNKWYFGLTLAFVIVPTLLMTAFSLRWYILDSKDPKAPKISNLQWGLRVFFLLLQLGPILRYVDAILWGWKLRKSMRIKNKELLYYHYDCMTYEDADATLLRLFESFLEAAPQLILQIYIMAQPVDKGDSRWTIIIQTVGVIGSLTSLAWSLVAQHRTMRLSMRDAKNLSWRGTVVMFLWRLFVIGARVIAMGLFASLFPIHFAWIMALRWIVMTSWIISMKTEFCDTKCEEFLYNSVLGAVFLFCYFNPKNDPTRWRYVIYYLYTLIENSVLMGVYYTYGSENVWYHFPAIVSHYLCFVMGLLFMALYYLLLHPSKSSNLSLDEPLGSNSRENGNIQTELSECNDNTGISNSSTIPEVGLFEPQVMSELLHSQDINDRLRNQNSYMEILAQIHDEKPIGTAV